MFANRFSFLSRLSTAFSNTLKTNLVTSSSAGIVSRTRQTNTNISRLNSSLALEKSTVQEANKQIESGTEGRLFAIVQLCGKQFKITSGDIIIVEGYWPPTNGERIRLDKVLLAGGKDFSLIGRPLVPHGLVDVQGTIIEKSLSHTRTHFRKKRRKQYMRINFFRTQQTMIRINSIELNQQGIREQDESPDPFKNNFF
ncbi:large ribosomal subunit protein bL21m [Topomyia yanbarensis]|uniref:large ribosomal subunit protein bL21m n=1 Tax=Topomyia yanbarensis TaxID=2498891 RepID=UPI00273C1822|nr:large ribosomal subunit protein bL21m [Topomyia yanbarensis]